MNYPPPPGFVPPHAPAPQSKLAKSYVPWIIGIFATLVALAVIGGVSAFRSASTETAAAEANASKFMFDLQMDDFNSAQKLMIPDAQLVTPVSKIKALQDAFKSIHGSIDSWGKPQWYVQATPNGTFVKLTYLVQCQKGASTITIVMKSLGSGAYGVYSFYYAM